MVTDEDRDPSTARATDDEEPDGGFTPSRLIVPGVGVAVLVFVASTRPEVITGSFGTVGSTLRVLGLITAFALFAWAVRRFVSSAVLGRALVWGVGGILVVGAVVPAYFDEEVDQDLATTAADLGLEDDTVDDASDQVRADPSSRSGATDPSTPDAPIEAEEAPPAPPVKLTTGRLSGLAGHRGSGEAAIYELADGTNFVRLDGFDVSNGPGIELWIVPRADAESPDGGTKLAGLPANTGNFNAPIPSGLDTDGDITVLIWCAPVGTPMAHATQAPA